MSFMKRCILHNFYSPKNFKETNPAWIFFFFLFACNTIIAQTKTEQVKNTIVGKAEKSSLTYQLINAPENTFGYDILDHNQLMIHQPSIPGLPGNKGFAKKAAAEKVARLVIDKISRNIMPPTITQKEMDSLHIKL